MTPSFEDSLHPPDLDSLLAVLGLVRSATGGSNYTVIRGNAGPRWLLPHRQDVARDVLTGWRPYSLRARLLWLPIRLAAARGLLPWLPGVERLSLPGDAGDRLLAGIGCREAAPPPVILVGNPSFSRKLIVLLSGPRPSVVKVALTPAARSAIAHEAEMLRRLEGRFGAPRLLHAAEEAGAARQQYRRGRLGSRRCKREVLNLLLELAGGGQKIALRDHAGAIAERLRRRPEFAAHAPRLEKAMALLNADATLPAAVVHGDFAPWNLCIGPNRSVALLDWEYARWQGLPMHDLCYFFYIQTLHFHPRRLFYDDLVRDGSWETYCRSLEIPLELAPRLAVAFTLEMLARTWENRELLWAEPCLEQLGKLLARVDGGAA